MTQRNPSSPRSPRLNASVRKRFLDHLAQTANVAASARHAGIRKDMVYPEFRRMPEFRREWIDALAEGYVRLETELLEDALRKASSQTSDAMLKAKAQKQRLQLGLLSAHRGTVKGNAPCIISRQPVADLPTLKAQLILKLTQMRERAGLSLDAFGKKDGEACSA